MKKLLTFLVTLSILTFSVAAQTVVTASEYFKSVSDKYSTIQDYESDVVIKINNDAPMTGTASFKKPELLRIDFTNPEGQVILFNGKDLTIYIPGLNAILEQTVDNEGGNSSVSGLSLLKRYYTIQYETTQNAVPYEIGSDEMVVNLLLTRRSSSEVFTSIKISINASDKLIRRVEAVTAQNDKYVFEFTNYQLNKNLPAARFIYDPPSSANNYKNFLYME